MTDKKDLQKDTGLYTRVANKVWNFFKSLRLTIILLITLALVSIIGTVVKQGETPDVYIKEYGERAYYWLSASGMTDMYHAWWFTILLVMLTLNIIVCTIDRFPSKWRSVLHQRTDVPLRFVQNLSNNSVISGVKGRPAEIKEGILELLRRHRYRFEVSNSPEEVTIMAYKGKWGRFGSDIVHLSIIIILVGAIMGSIWGFRGFQAIYVGDTRAIPNTDFKIKVNRFWMDYYEDGQVKQYNSDLTVLEDGKEVLNKVIYVNEPLEYKGVRFFQSSYGLAWGKIRKAQLALMDKQTGKEIGKPFFINWNERLEVPSLKGYEIKLIGFVSDFAFDENRKFVYAKSIEHNNPAIQVEIIKDGKRLSTPWIFLNFPGLFPVLGDSKYELVLKTYQPIMYTGLQITRDPGVNVVWFGSVLMGIGFILAFFVFHKRLWIKVRSCSNTAEIYVGGMINKNRMIFEREFKEFIGSLKERFKVDQA